MGFNSAFKGLIQSRWRNIQCMRNEIGNHAAEAGSVLREKEGSIVLVSSD